MVETVIKPICTYEFSCGIIRNFDGRWLAVNEVDDRGWWIPAGAVDANESFLDGLHRETLEEAGIKVKVLGVFRVEHRVSKSHCRMRVIYFGEPIDKN